MQDRVISGRDSRSFAGPQMSDNYDYYDSDDDDSAEEDELEDAM